MTVSKETQDLLEKFRAILPKAREQGKVLTFEEAWQKGKLDFSEGEIYGV